MIMTHLISLYCATLCQHQSLRFVKSKIKVVGAKFERVIHAAPRSAHAPGLFKARSPLRSRSSYFWPAPLRFPLRSHALADVAKYESVTQKHLKSASHRTRTVVYTLCSFPFINYSIMKIKLQHYFYWELSIINNKQEFWTATAVGYLFCNSC